MTRTKKYKRNRSKRTQKKQRGGGIFGTLRNILRKTFGSKSDDNYNEWKNHFNYEKDKLNKAQKEEERLRKKIEKEKNELDKKMKEDKQKYKKK